MLIQPLRSGESRILSSKVNFLDILIISPQYFYKKSMGQDKRICYLGLRDKLAMMNNIVHKAEQCYLHIKVSIWPVEFLQFWIVSDAYITLPKIFFLFWPDFPVKTRFKFHAGATPFKIGRLIKSKRVLGLAGRDVISGKKNFHNSLNKKRFIFRKDVVVDFSLGKHDNTQ